MIVDYTNLEEIIFYGLSFFAIYYLLYRKYIYSLLDPLFIFIATTSFASVLVLYTLGDRPLYKYHFFVSQFFFFLGFPLFYLLRKDDNKNLSTIGELKINSITINSMYVLFIIYLLANIVILKTTGFAIFSDNPTAAKVENFTNGFGILRKINWGLGLFIIFGFFYLLLTKFKWIDLILLLIICFFSLLDGSKAAVLKIIMPLMLLLSHSFFNNKQRLRKYINFSIPLILIAVLGIAFSVLNKESQDSEATYFAFLKRLLYSADSTLFFYLPVNEQYFSRIHAVEFIPHIIRPIFAFLRLMPYKEAFGNVMVMNALPDATGAIVGPNTPFYIEGQIFFGYYGSFMYSLLLGYLYASLRNYFFTTTYHSAFWFLLIACLTHLASALTNELTLFITQAFDTCFFVIPVYVMVSLVTSGSIRIRSPFLRQFIVK